jgi:hypothetical protein
MVRVELTRDRNSDSDEIVADIDMLTPGAKMKRRWLILYFHTVTLSAFFCSAPCQYKYLQYIMHTWTTVLPILVIVIPVFFHPLVKRETYVVSPVHLSLFRFVLRLRLQVAATYSGARP